MVIGLAFLVVGFSRKMLEGVFLPFGVLSVFGIRYLFGQIRKLNIPFLAHAFSGVFCILFVLSFLFIFLSEMYSIQHHAYPYFVTVDQHELLVETSDRVENNEVILASPLISQFVPGVSYRRVYFADPHQTFDYENKRDQVFGFFYEELSPDEQIDFLRIHDIDFVLLSGGDVDLGAKIDVHDLDVVFENSAGVLYAVGE